MDFIYQSQVTQQLAQNMSRTVSVLGAFRDRLDEADRVSQYSSGLAAMDRAFLQYNRGLKDKRWARPRQSDDVPGSVDASGLEGSNGASAELTIGQIDEEYLAADHQTMVQAQRDFIRRNFSHRKAQEQLLQVLEQRAAQNYDSAAKLWSTHRMQQMVFSSDANINYYAQKKGLTPDQRMLRINAQLQADVNNGLRLADDAAMYRAKLQDQIQSAWAVGTAVEQAKAAKWDTAASDAWLDENTPFWDGDPVKRMAAKNDVRKIAVQEKTAIFEAQEAAGREVYAKFQEILTTDWKSLDRNKILEIRGKVDSTHVDEMDGYLERWDKAHNLVPEQQVENDQLRNELQMRAKLSKWIRDGRRGPMPWDEDTLVEMSAPAEGGVARLSREQAKTMMTDLEKVYGATEALVDPQALAASRVASKLYGSMAGKVLTDPTSAVAEGEIERARDAGEITPQKADELLALRLRLRDDYARATASKPEDPKALYAAGISAKLFGAVAQDTPEDPWTVVSEGTIERALADGRITPDQHDELLALRRTLHGDYQKTLPPEQKPEDPRAVYAAGIESTLYGAVARTDPKDPWLVVRDGVIEQDLAEGRITPAQHGELIRLRYNLHQDFLRAGLMDRTTAEGEQNAYQICYNPTMPMAEKQAAIDKLVTGGGLSGADGATWRGRIDLYNGDDERKAVFDDLEAYYRDAIQNATNQNEQKRLALQRAHARDYMDAFMRKTPADPEAWRKARDGYLAEEASNDVRRLATDLLGEKTIVYTPQARTEGRGVYRTAAMIEFLRESGKLSPAELTAYERDQKGRALQLEGDVLREAKVSAVVTAPLPGDPNTTVYFTERPDRDAANQPLPTDKAMVVLYSMVDGDLVPGLYRYNPASGRFDTRVWSAK